MPGNHEGRQFDIGDTQPYAAEQGSGVQIPSCMLVLAGQNGWTFSFVAAEFIAARIPEAVRVVLENGAHMTPVEENDADLSSVRAFLSRNPDVNSPTLTVFDGCA